MCINVKPFYVCLNINTTSKWQFPDENCRLRLQININICVETLIDIQMIFKLAPHDSAYVVKLKLCWYCFIFWYQSFTCKLFNDYNGWHMMTINICNKNISTFNWKKLIVDTMSNSVYIW